MSFSPLNFECERLGLVCKFPKKKHEIEFAMVVFEFDAANNQIFNLYNDRLWVSKRKKM